MIIFENIDYFLSGYSILLYKMQILDTKWINSFAQSVNIDDGDYKGLIIVTCGYPTKCRAKGFWRIYFLVKLHVATLCLHSLFWQNFAGKKNCFKINLARLHLSKTSFEKAAFGKTSFGVNAFAKLKKKE